MRRRGALEAVALAAGLVSCTTAATPRATLAITDVTVIPMDDDRVLRGYTVAIAGDRILRVAPHAQIAGTVTSLPHVEGRGRYLLPGLADMHVHIWDEDDLLLYLANGVTTVRNMNGSPFHLRWREEIRRGERLGPDLYTSGPTIYREPDDAEAVVREQQEAGYDFIKLYHFMSPAAYRSVLQAARVRGMRAVGHRPPGPSNVQAIGMGMESLEHLLGYGSELERLPSPLHDALVRGQYSFRYTYAGVDIDENKLSAAATQMAGAGGWICPTLVAMDRWAPRDELAPLKARPHMKYVSPSFFARSESWDEARFLADSTAGNRAQGRRVRRSIVRQLHRAGARLILGTDGGSEHTEPGFSIHDELAAMVDAGLTPYEALRTGTIAAGTYLRQARQLGVVRSGARADLVLLDANPLESIAHTRRIAGIVARGRWIDTAALTQRMEALARSWDR